MDAVTIPHRLAQKDDLVVIPKREYRAFCAWRKNVKIRLDEEAWFWTSEWQKMEAEADEAIRKGQVSGPYTDIQVLLRDLKKGK